MTAGRLIRFVDDELVQFADAAAAGDREGACRALERAHILAQPRLAPHLRVHWAMLRYALREGDARETAGHVFRIALAPVGALIGRIPAGNTGRANLSAFAAMPVPADLRARLDEVGQ